MGRGRPFRVIAKPLPDRRRGAAAAERRLAIRKAMQHEPSIDWLLENQEKVGHSFHQFALEGRL